MANRLIELAIEALETQRSVIDKEITALRAGFRAGIRALQARGKPAPRKSGKRTSPIGKSAPKKKRGMSAAAKKAQSLRMKAYWAKRRKQKSEASQK